MSKKYPVCNNCGHAMVWSFAMRGCEYVCLPCDEGVAMWNSNDKVERSVSSMNAKKNRWSEELSIIGRRFGGGSCALCDDKSCDLCVKTADPDYKFKIWRRNLRELTPTPPHNKGSKE